MRDVLSVIAALLYCLTLQAQHFEPKEYDGLQYQQLANKIDGAEKPALVVFLHGGHARGEDNQKQIQLQAVKDIRDYILKNNMPAYFLVPQCPSDREWIPNRGALGCKDKVLGLIQQYVDEKGIDPNRIYLCSVSMGSWASWVLVKEHPDLFAAAFIASGNHKSVSPAQLTCTPLYITVGSQERSLDAIKWLATEVQKAGGTVKFNSLSGCDHPKACNKAFTAKRLDWLFAQKKTVKLEQKMKTLVAYFSATGTTEAVAKDLAEVAGATLYEIKPEVKYTAADLDWRDKQSRSSVEMADKSSRPAIVKDLEDADSYDVIYIGFPIWWYTAPTIINTFIEAYGFAGKTVIFFATSGGSDVAGADKQFHAQYSAINWKPGKLLNNASKKMLQDCVTRNK